MKTKQKRRRMSILYIKLSAPKAKRRVFLARVFLGAHFTNKVAPKLNATPPCSRYSLDALTNKIPSAYSLKILSMLHDDRTTTKSRVLLILKICTYVTRTLYKQTK